MPAGGRVMGARNKKSRIIFAALAEFLSLDRPVTIRYALYQLVCRGIPLCKGECSTSAKCSAALSSLTRAARVSGEIDDACFVDNRCEVQDGGAGWVSLAQYMRPRDPREYYRNRWLDQTKHPTEVWLENRCLEVEALEVLKIGELGARLESASLQYGVDVARWEASERKQEREIKHWLRAHPEG